jgi:hypothetical protein
MITVAGGDSFVWGSELADSPHGGPGGWSMNTFTALLSSEGYRCAAYPGFGNRDIANSVIVSCQGFNPDMVIVCWTWATRDNELDSDQHILRLEEYLNKHKIGYMFTCADNCIITGKLNYSNWFMFPSSENPWDTMEPRGFYQWAVENKYLVGPENHPLEQAHLDASKLMQGKFNELVKKHLQQN